jgi:hypothetical protein
MTNDMIDEMKTLQLFYAGALSDAAYHYGRHGVLEAVTLEKKKRQDEAAPGQLRQLGIQDLPGLYSRFAEIFGCADWRLETEGDCVRAETTVCMLCGIAKKQGSAKPCDPFCINPFSAYARAFGYELHVQETLWEGKRCLFVNRRKRRGA